MEIKLTDVTKLIQECWTIAEAKTQELILEKFPVVKEEDITLLFTGEFRETIRVASDLGRIDRAFVADLQRSVPSLGFDIARRVGGLLARINPHDRSHEGRKSGADFGLVVARPLVYLQGSSAIRFERDHATGLLAQAKLGRPPKKSGKSRVWGGLTSSQVKLYPKRREYYSLLLYRVNGNKLNNLAPFGWQLCREHTALQVRKFLTKDAFPTEISSSDLLGRLFARTIGTDKPKIIESIIDPANSGHRVIEIQIFWPDGGGPPPSLPVHAEHRQIQQQRLWQ
jgi:hypothetical protein